MIDNEIREIIDEGHRERDDSEIDDREWDNKKIIEEEMIK